MSEEKKTRVRRSLAEVRAEKKAKYQEEIKKHQDAIKVLEDKIKELDKPVKTPAQEKEELLKKFEKKSLKELKSIAAAAGIEIGE